MDEITPPWEAPAPDALPAVPAGVAGDAPPFAASPVPVAGPRKRRGRRGCLIGCLGAFLGLALIALVAAGWFFNWPAQWGLVDTPSERLFASSPDPYAAEAITAELEAQGIGMKGVTLYVLPAQEATGQIAYFLVEDAKGAKWSHPEYRSATEGLLVLTALTKAASEHGVTRVAVDYRDEKDLQVAVLTAPTDVLAQYGAHEITREQLFDRTNGYADIAGFLAGMRE